MNSPSIRRNLVLGTGMGVGFLLCLLALLTYWMVRAELHRQTDAAIRQRAALLANQVELEHGRITYEWQEGIGTNPVATGEGFFQYWDEHTGETTRSPALGDFDLPKFHGLHGEPILKTIALPGNGHAGRALGMVVYPFIIPEELKRMEADHQLIDPKSLPHVLVVASDLEPVNLALARLRWVLSLGTPSVLAIGWFLIHWIVRHSLRPLDQLATQVRNRSVHDIDAALEVPGRLPGELRGLASDFSELLSRVAAIRDRERDFLRHAAHELRTPIAGLKAVTELALSKPRELASYVGYLETCRNSAENLAGLVSRLSALAKIGHASHPTERLPVDLKRMFLKTVEEFSAICGKPLPAPEIREPDQAIIALADPAWVKVICNNLVDNFISHGQSSGSWRVSFSLDPDGSSVSFTVANPVESFPKDLELLFEPLFHQHRISSGTDAARHMGIGLTLSQDAARAMGGSLVAREGTDHWLEFVLTLPAANG